MIKYFFSYLVFLAFIGCKTPVWLDNTAQGQYSKKVIFRLGITDGKLSEEWRAALAPRMTRQELDSVSALTIQVSEEEKEWMKLIASKMDKWLAYADSLKIPFKNCQIPDTIYVLSGHSGIDDAFTYEYNTVCFDLSALQNNYGKAALIENSNRMDRLFAHELTHLLHKSWAKVKGLQLKTFKDSVLWECLYEGIGTYRSLSAKWLPKNGIMPENTVNAISELSPVFVDKLTALETSDSLDKSVKSRITANLSRGQVNRKWGAFTVAIWLALEANDDGSKLTPWIDKGLNSVILLAKKYLNEKDRKNFENVFK